MLALVIGGEHARAHHVQAFAGPPDVLTIEGGVDRITLVGYNGLWAHLPDTACLEANVVTDQIAHVQPPVDPWDLVDQHELLLYEAAIGGFDLCEGFVMISIDAVQLIDGLVLSLQPRPEARQHVHVVIPEPSGRLRTVLLLQPEETRLDAHIVGCDVYRVAVTLDRGVDVPLQELSGNDRAVAVRGATIASGAYGGGLGVVADQPAGRELGKYPREDLEANILARLVHGVCTSPIEPPRCHLQVEPRQVHVIAVQPDVPHGLDLAADELGVLVRSEGGGLFQEVRMVTAPERERARDRATRRQSQFPLLSLSVGAVPSAGVNKLAAPKLPARSPNWDTLISRQKSLVGLATTAR